MSIRRKPFSIVEISNIYPEIERDSARLYRSLLNIPWDVLRNIIILLSAKDLSHLALTSKEYYNLVINDGWKIYCKKMGLDTFLYESRESASPIMWSRVAKYGTIVNSHWSRKEYRIIKFGERYRPIMPALCLNSRILATSTGPYVNILFNWRIDNTHPILNSSHRLTFKADYSDVASLALTATSLWTGSVTIKQWDLSALKSPNPSPSLVLPGHGAGTRSITISPSSTHLFSIGCQDETLKVWSASPSSSSSNDPCLHTFPLPSRPWTLFPISDNLLAVGGNKPASLMLYDLAATGVSCIADLNTEKSAVYALRTHEAHPHTLLVGLYTGGTRLYDLRTHTTVAWFTDPYNENPIYSVDYDYFRVAAGTSANSLVCLWDLRYNTNSAKPSSNSGRLHSLKGKVKDGWSVYLGRVPSPVYALRLGFQSLVGVTDKENVVLDFGSGIRDTVRGGRGREKIIDKNVIKRIYYTHTGEIFT